MADGFKSFDELYKEVIGKEPPPKDSDKPSRIEGSVKMDRKKSADLLTDPSRGRNTYGSGQKKKQNRKTTTKKRNKHAPYIDTSKANRKKTEAELDMFVGRLKQLSSSVKCPVHEEELTRGLMARPQDSSDNTEFFFCKKCKSFYYVSTKPVTKRNSKLSGYQIIRINPSSPDNVSEREKVFRKTVLKQFDEYIENNGIKLRRTSEPSPEWCLECGRNISDSNEEAGLSVKFTDGTGWRIAGAYCNNCGTLNVSEGRISNMIKSRSGKVVDSVILRKGTGAKPSAKLIQTAKERFDPKTTTLYVHQGYIKCLKEHHKVINVTLRIPSTIKRNSVVINANYCFDCDRFFISSDEYEHYRSIYPIMLIRFEYVSDSGLGRYLADKSPLMMAGYSVRANLKYSDAQRQNILRNVIELGILKKHEVINYLNYFISMNGKARGMEAAVSKWEKDLEYVRTHNFELQKRATADNIKRW